MPLLVVIGAGWDARALSYFFCLKSSLSTLASVAWFSLQLVFKIPINGPFLLCGHFSGFRFLENTFTSSFFPKNSELWHGNQLPDFVFLRTFERLSLRQSLSTFLLPGIISLVHNSSLYIFSSRYKTGGATRKVFQPCWILDIGVALFSISDVIQTRQFHEKWVKALQLLPPDLQNFANGLIFYFRSGG